tara:strand:- start:170 stop:1006 length:837 start_codon:yes stop_codon:yes gene_type:complete
VRGILFLNMLKEPIITGDTQTNAEFVVSGNHIVRRVIVETPVVNAAELMATIAKSKSCFYPALLNYGDKHLDLLDSEVDNHFTVFGKISKIPFNCSFTAKWLSKKEDFQTIHPKPRHGNGTNVGEVKEKLMWSPNALKEFVDPKTQLYLAAGVSRSDNHQQLLQVYLLLFSDGEFRQMPYPNVYLDGRVCMGEEFERNNTQISDMHVVSMAEIWGIAYNSFMSSSMNSDLSDPSCEDFFSFGLSSKEPTNTKEIAEKQKEILNSRSISNKYLNGFRII